MLAVFDVHLPLCLQLIRVCADHGQVVSALNVYEWMKAPRSAGGAALTPTVYTYTAAMRAALSANMLDKAMQIWSDCESARCRPDCRLSITFIEVRPGSRWLSQAVGVQHGGTLILFT